MDGVGEMDGRIVGDADSAMRVGDSLHVFELSFGRSSLLFYQVRRERQFPKLLVRDESLTYLSLERLSLEGGARPHESVPFVVDGLE